MTATEPQPLDVAERDALREWATDQHGQLVGLTNRMKPETQEKYITGSRPAMVLRLLDDYDRLAADWLAMQHLWELCKTATEAQQQYDNAQSGDVFQHMWAAQAAWIAVAEYMEARDDRA